MYYFSYISLLFHHGPCWASCLRWGWRGCPGPCCKPPQGSPMPCSCQLRMRTQLQMRRCPYHEEKKKGHPWKAVLCRHHNKIDWPQKVLYTCAGDPAVHEELTNIPFVNGFLTLRGGESDTTKVSMLLHLQQLMEDTVAYGWETDHSYHAAWLQHLEQGRAIWNDPEKRLTLWRALVWHRVIPTTTAAAARSQPSRQQTQPSVTKPQMRNIVYSQPCSPGDKACQGFNRGTCTGGSAYPPDLHVCSYCAKAVLPHRTVLQIPWAHKKWGGV